jgi:hypothetical protein
MKVMTLASSRDAQCPPAKANFLHAQKSSDEIGNGEMKVYQQGRSEDSGEELEPPAYEEQLTAYWETEFPRRSIPPESGITTSTGDLIEITDDRTSQSTHGTCWGERRY